MSNEPVVAEEPQLVSNDLEHPVDSQAELITSSTGATLTAEEHATAEYAPAPLSCEATRGADVCTAYAALDEPDSTEGADLEVKADELNPHAVVAVMADVEVVDPTFGADAACPDAVDERHSEDGAELQATIGDQNPDAEIAAVADVETGVRTDAQGAGNEVISSRDVSEHLSFGNLFDERSNSSKKSTVSSSDLSELTPSDVSPELYPFELEQRARGKTELSNDILLDVFAWLQRFELDIMHIISRKFRDAANASVPQFSYRYINVVEYRNGRLEFSVNVFLRGEIAVRNFDSCPDYFSAVQSDRRRWLVSESDTKRAFRRLRYSFVEFFFVQHVPKPSILDLLRGPEASFLVGTLVLYRAPLKRVGAKAFNRLVFSFKGFNELVVTRCLLNRRLLTDDFLRYCASHGITYVAVDGHSRQCTQLTDNGLLSFVATVVRSCNVTCRLLVGNIKPDASEWLLFKFIESAKQGKLVDYFCVALANAPEQQLGEYEALRQTSKISHFSWRLYAEQVQLEAYRGRKSLYIARNHSKVNCDCLVRVIALNREARKRASLCLASNC